MSQGKDVKAFKTRRRCKDGTELDVWLTITALKDESDRPVELATTERNLAWLADD